MGDRKPFPILLLAAGALALFIGALVLVLFVSMKKESNEELCRANLTVLGMAIRVGELPSSPKWDAMGKGRDFFRNQEKWPTYQQRELDLYCPVLATRKDCDYRGPAKLLREIRNDEPIAADRIGNHGPEKGGNVLLKTGAVHTAGLKDALWTAAGQTTSD
ncbi:MAG: hypothetical protein JO332_10820 [Planctomycetaceae bacterium]|nr:hypothetical protein [Planctomycetaceae bacterium]